MQLQCLWFLANLHKGEHSFSSTTNGFWFRFLTGSVLGTTSALALAASIFSGIWLLLWRSQLVSLAQNLHVALVSLDAWILLRFVLTVKD
jgi:hypothetical protein